MDINISGVHLNVNDSIRAYATEKFERAERILHDIRNIEVILKHDDRKIHCEVLVHTRRGKPLVIDATGEELNEAIDLAVDKVERKLRRLKEKSTSHRRKAIRPKDAAPAGE